MSNSVHLTGPVLIGRDDVRDECWVRDGVVTFEPPAGDTERIDGWVLPGLVDAHCHVGLDRHGAVSQEESERQAITDRDAGALLLRDAGSPADTRWIAQRPDLPKLIRAGRHIARTKRYIRNFAHEIEPEQLPEFMAQEASAGDGWVKIVGDWINRDTGDLDLCWPQGAVSAGIAAAHANGARVTAHCFATVSLAPLMRAGIDCIEHATGLDDDTIALAAETGTAIVPTLVNIETFPDIAATAEAKFPNYAAHMRDLHRRRYETISNAHDAGIAIFCGTDAGGSLSHGLVADEIKELTKAGLSTLEAIDAASWAARAWLGHPGIKEGAPADLIITAADPRSEIGSLATPTAVILNGVVVA